MRKGIALTVASLLAVGGLTACGDEPGEGGTGGGSAKRTEIGVILPDTTSSARWETADRKYLEAAFKAAGVGYEIQNAQGDRAAFQKIADRMIRSGVNVLMITNLDSASGKAVLDKAKTQGVETIDYDRMTLGGSADYYVSFDGPAVGKLQGEGLVRCLTEKGVRKPLVAQLHGSPTDYNATLFKQGYDSVLKPRFASDEYRRGPDKPVPDWNAARAETIFSEMLANEPGIGGVLAANDGIANAVISVLARNDLLGKVPVTGQDATLEGLRHVLLGEQCMTVYKAIKQQANAASDLAISLAQGQKKELTQTVRDPTGKRDVPAVLLTPKAIFADNVKDVVDDGYVTVGDLCTGAIAVVCTERGIT